jgi:hypothetical protein
MTHWQMAKEYDGRLNFMTNAWTSPNGKAFIALTVHFEENGAPACNLLDILELVQLHSRQNLATAIVNILDDFGISDKVRVS